MTADEPDYEAEFDALRKKKMGKYKHYRPLADSVEDIRVEAQDSQRIYTGIPNFDYEMRGVGRGHLLNIVGYSHSGKTLVLLKILQANKSKRIAYFAPDETRSLILTKMTAIEHGVGGKQLESEIANGNQAAIDLLRRTALQDYPNLAVFDGHLTPQTINEALREAEQEWGDKEELVIIDYMDLFDYGETAPQKFNWVKAFNIARNIPVIAIHQASRSSGAKGREMDIDSGNFGGEQQATFQIGVRRKKAEFRDKLQAERQKANPDPLKIEEYQKEIDIHNHTLSCNLNKNKRIGGETVDEIDFEIETGTGFLRQMEEDELPKAWLAKQPNKPPVKEWEDQQIDYDF